MISLGSDTGGSVRQPADFCGVVGLKPSYGRVSRYGLIAYGSSFDQIGVLAKNIDDAGITLEVIAGGDAYDSTVVDTEFEYADPNAEENGHRYTVGYFPSTFEHPGLDPEIAKTQKAFIDELAAHDIAVKPIDFDLLDYIVPAYYILTTAEASSNLSRYDGIKYGAVACRKPAT
jgi:aspartyl-tRNA(Asn)/glutamyl-tRNA(Gln) amidotransferase subunit A